jgi:hypothetical protein
LFQEEACCNGVVIFDGLRNIDAMCDGVRSVAEDALILDHGLCFFFAHLQLTGGRERWGNAKSLEILAGESDELLLLRIEGNELLEPLCGSFLVPEFAVAFGDAKESGGSGLAAFVEFRE